MEAVSDPFGAGEWKQQFTLCHTCQQSSWIKTDREDEQRRNGGQKSRCQTPGWQRQLKTLRLKIVTFVQGAWRWGGGDT